MSLVDHAQFTSFIIYHLERVISPLPSNQLGGIITPPTSAGNAAFTRTVRTKRVRGRPTVAAPLAHGLLCRELANAFHRNRSCYK